MLELGYFSTNRQCRRSNAKAGWGALRCGAVSSVAFSPLLGVVTASGFSLDANVGGLATGTTALFLVPARQLLLDHVPSRQLLPDRAPARQQLLDLAPAQRFQRLGSTLCYMQLVPVAA
ncbi:hypothetical protein PF008_g5515 [Phytophthora fragariae]|uniref:Uncharacterized protein n=1 Tax=Phytophthora fragariae TaxID=53985 RepID=A0A6G0S9U0_9STRA|nr:hypothetical protein PF008_g5515 [Phytophthora fragariae]